MIFPTVSWRLSGSVLTNIGLVPVLMLMELSRWIAWLRPVSQRATSINTASPFACLRCQMTGGFSAKASAFLVVGFVGIIGGSGMGPGWSCPHIYRHIRYMCHLCSIAIGWQDFRLLTSNGVSALLYLSYI